MDENIHQAATSAAHHLGPGWAAQPCDVATDGARCSYGHHRPILIGPDDIALMLTAVKGRVWVEAALGLEEDLRKYLPHHHAWRLEISVSASRPVEALARDIERRLLPGTRAAFARCRLGKKTDRHREEYERDRFARLARAMGGEPSSWEVNGNLKHRVNLGDHLDRVGGHAERSSSDRIRFEIDVDPSLALKLARFIGQLHRESREIPAENPAGSPRT